MPELPEVETVVRMLAAKLAGLRVLRVTLARSDILKSPRIDLQSALLGRSFTSISRCGKKILLLLLPPPPVLRERDGVRVQSQGASSTSQPSCADLVLCIHLGMSGQLTIDPADAPVRSHTHFTIDLDGNGAADSRAMQLRFRDPRRFGGIWLFDSPDAADTNLGPEPLTLRPTQLAALLSKTRRPIKSALLDQSLIAGLGNIYVDESLFAAAIHPLTPANRLSDDQVRRLTRAIKTTLRRAIRHGGSSIRDYIHVNGGSGRFQDLHNVYARENRPCPRCRTPIQRLVLSGRSTHFCPICQKPGTGPICRTRPRRGALHKSDLSP